MLKRLKIWQKFTLIAFAFSLPIAILTYLLITETNKNLDFAGAELDGTQYLRPLRKLVVDVSAHRDLAAAVLAGDAALKSDLDKKAEEIEADFKALDAVDAKFAWEFGQTDVLKAVRQSWQGLRANLPTSKVDPSFDEHTKFMRTLLQYSYRLGNASNLILDPDVDSYYTMDAIIFKIAKVTEEVGRARAIGAAYLASGGQGDANSVRKSGLAEASVRIDDALQQETDFIRYARDFNKQTDGAVSGGIAEQTKAVRAFSAFIGDKIVNGTGELMPIKDFLTASNAALVESAKLWEVTAAELDRLLELRVAALSRSRMIDIAVVAVVLALTILFLFVVVRAITQPIAHLRDVADKISLGDMDAQIHIDTKDEIGELGDSFRRLQVSLKEAMDALERQGESVG